MYKKITKDELDVFLRKHKLWLIGDPDGQKADLQGADLWGADLRRADLRGADLQGADLWGADLQKADLQGADLWGADLQKADLQGADLWRADLQGADLQGANLQKADLRRADLWGANLRRADLRGADLQGADLRRADLQKADLQGAKNGDYPIACPEKGSFTAFKKANNYIVELLILDDALRSSSTTRKCRCSKAKVIAITNLDSSSCDVTSIPSNCDGDFIYTIGEIVEAANFDNDRWNECAPGIHFFITRQEAVEY